MTQMAQEYNKPLPGVDEENKPFWDYARQHELRVQKCKECGQLFYPPESHCPHCLSSETEWVKLSGKGTVFSYIIVRRAAHPVFAKEVPYIVAIIETAEGVRLISNVINCDIDKVTVGMPVEVVFVDATKEISLPKFQPAAK